MYFAFYSISIILIACNHFTQLAHACGIATHTEVAHRAAFNYEYLLDNTISIREVRINFWLILNQYKFYVVTKNDF
jgi:hypothetical protein